MSGLLWEKKGSEIKGRILKDGKNWMNENMKWRRLDMKKELLDAVEEKAYESKF